ncbi:hypothetical protein [Cellulomonas sp. URHD0024]|uniref:hypothetical protein n=1 Tax=Cellulomonas sp. URHD0024 TaxID=1302620 RepID=UPI0004199D4D|nr:hypothetical protein [Cellulomonas sp. URHD0024]
MTRVAIVGRGRLGSAVRDALVDRDVEVVQLSRADGFDVTRPISFEAHGPLDLVVEATDVFTNDARKATAFFEASTRHIGAAAAAAGIGHLLVSIVGCTAPALASNGYYAGKAAQERAFLTGPSKTTLLRTTLWFEFARQNTERLRVGPVALVPSMRVKPVALDAVAEVVAQRCTGLRTFDELDVSGPGVTTLWEMTKALPSHGLAVPLLVPGAGGRALRDGTLLPSTTAEIVGPTFESWLAAAPR